MPAESLYLFLAATLAVNLTPGPSILFCTGVAASAGFRAALAAIAGMSCGIFVHVLLAATGITATLATSATAFAVLQLTGAAFLIIIGLRLLIHADTAGAMSTDSTGTPRRYFLRGVMVDLFNPKIGLFFLIFLPQFVDHGTALPFWTTVKLGLIFCVCGAVVNTTIALASARASTLLPATAASWLRRWLPGSLLVLVGARLIFQNR